MDDEAPIRNLARELLSFLGYEATTAESGEQAIDLYMEAKVLPSRLMLSFLT